MLKAEDALLRHCARTEITTEKLSKIKEMLSPVLDWAYFFDKAQSELLTPLVYKTLLKIEGSQAIIPADIWQRFKDIYYSTLSDNISHLAQLEKVTAALQSRNVEAIIFKGLMLAESVYKDMGLRSIGDIDILLRREDIFKADEILRGFGYHTNFDIKNFREVNFNNYRNSFFYVNRDEKQIPIHVYWHIVNLIPYNERIFCAIDIDKIWAEAEAIRLGDVSLFTFSQYHQIIYLSMHALGHCFYPLTLLCDINEFLRLTKDKLDWERLICEAYGFGLYKHVYYTLYLANRILEAEIPLGALDKLRPKKMSFFERRFISSVLKGRPVFTWDSLLYVGMNETLTDRLLFLLKASFPPKAELALIRQKDVSQINTLDYIRRVNSGIRSAAKALFN